MKHHDIVWLTVCLTILFADWLVTGLISSLFTMLKLICGKVRHNKIIRKQLRGAYPLDVAQSLAWDPHREWRVDSTFRLWMKLENARAAPLPIAFNSKNLQQQSICCFSQCILKNISALLSCIYKTFFQNSKTKIVQQGKNCVIMAIYSTKNCFLLLFFTIYII